LKEVVIRRSNFGDDVGQIFIFFRIIFSRKFLRWEQQVLDKFWVNFLEIVAVSTI